LRHEEEITSFDFSPDGRRILTLSESRAVRLWDASTGVAVGPALSMTGLSTAAHSVRMVECLPPVAMITRALLGPRVRQFQLATINTPRQRRFHRVQPGRRSPGDGLSGWTVELWDVATREALFRPLLHDQKVFRADFSPDGRWLAISSEGNRVRLWDTHTGKMLAPPLVHNTLAGRRYSVRTATLVLTVQRDLTMGREEVAAVWSLARAEPPALRIRPTSSFRQIAYSPNSRFMATIRGDTIQAAEVASGKPLTQPLTQTLPFRRAYFSRDNAMLISESVDGRGQVWDLSRGEPLTPLMKIRYDFSAQEPAKEELPQHLSTDG